MAGGVGSGPRFDADCAAGLAAWPGGVRTSLAPEEIAEVRAEPPLDPATGDDALRRGGTRTVAEHRVPGPPGAPDLTLLVCRPAAATGPVPALYHVHGGGLVAGNRRTLITLPLDLAAAHGAAVVSVEYRLAPEHPGTAPVEDCYAGLAWTAAHAADLGIDPARIVLLGVSAGGGLAAGTALLARDRGGPAPHAQMLLAPMLDDRNDTPSARQLDGAGVWDRAANRTGWRALLGDRQGGPDVPAYAAPARAAHLGGLPPAFLDVGSAEVFRDETVAYASRIWAAGGDAELHVWPGGFHGYDVFAPDAPLSRATVRARADWLARTLARPGA